MLNFTSRINKDKKRFVILVIALFLIIVIFRTYTFRSIDYKYTGFIYQVGNLKYGETINIEIKGKYTIGLFGSFDEFDGQIIIGDKIFNYSNLVQKDNQYKKIPLILKTGDKSIYGDLFL
jgi:hypothetical protein